MNFFPSNATVVLTHGAWADGSCWQNVVLSLRQSGLKATCVQLPLTSLTDDIASLQRVIERTSGPLLLAAHAYGGAVIAGLSDDRIKSLVYIAALAPDEGETVAEVFYRGDPHPEAPRLAPDKHNLIWMPEDGFRHAVAHNASADQLAVMAAVQRPISLKCIQEKASPPAWRSKPSWYLLAEEDRMILRDNQQHMAGRMGATVQSYPVDHSPMLTASDLVVQMILDAADQTMHR